MGKISLETVKNKIEDHMLLGAIYDNIMMKTKYKDEKLAFLYNVMIAQKHRMLYYKKLKKNFLSKCVQAPKWEKKEKVIHSDIIWVCWLQGFENAPEIVKRCIDSLEKNIKGKKIIYLDENNIKDYVTFPDYIMEKWKKGCFGSAHFTDLLRLELLTQYGGYWIDATVLCTDAKMVELIDSEPLFMYSFYYFGFNPEIMELNTWLIHSCTNNNILSLTKELLYEYWKKYDRLVDYFLTHLFLTMAVEYYQEEYDRMPIVSQVDAHVLATYIFDEYNEYKYELLKKTTGIHKLSTRFDAEKMKKKGTFFDIVIQQGKI